MDELSITGLVFTGCHGVNPHEKVNKQRFSVDVSLDVDLSLAAETDLVAHTVNWSTVRNVVKAVVEEESFNMVEALALRIVTTLLEEKHIQCACVTVRKLDAWCDHNGVPAITLERGQS